MEQLTIVQYIEKVKPLNKKDGNKISRQGVLWRINHQLELPQVIKIEKIGSQYVITVHP